MLCLVGRWSPDLLAFIRKPAADAMTESIRRHLRPRRGRVVPVARDDRREFIPLAMSQVTLEFGKFYTMRFEKRLRLIFANIYKHLVRHDGFRRGLRTWIRQLLHATEVLRFIDAASCTADLLFYVLASLPLSIYHETE